MYLVNCLSILLDDVLYFDKRFFLEENTKGLAKIFHVQDLKQGMMEKLKVLFYLFPKELGKLSSKHLNTILQYYKI